MRLRKSTKIETEKPIEAVNNMSVRERKKHYWPICEEQNQRTETKPQQLLKSPLKRSKR
jgi:hypothetical protein